MEKARGPAFLRLGDRMKQVPLGPKQISGAKCLGRRVWGEGARKVEGKAGPWDPSRSPSSEAPAVPSDPPGWTHCITCPSPGSSKPRAIVETPV